MYSTGLIDQDQYLRRFYLAARKNETALEIFERMIMEDARKKKQDPEDVLNQFYERMEV